MSIYCGASFGGGQGYADVCGQEEYGKGTPLAQCRQCMRQEIHKLKSENECLRKDAERYRWLKERGVSRQIVGSCSQSVGSGPYIIVTLPSCGAPSSIALTFESADYVIDAAISSPENPS